MNSLTRRMALIAGPAILLFCINVPPQGGMSQAAWLTAGITSWMAIWWILELIPPPVTALLPLVLFPLCGVMPLKTISSEYSSEIIYLFLAGFIIGKAIERWNLHRRIALRMVAWTGNEPGRVVLGFMIATAFISMWISNTATVVMMTPVAVAVAIGHPIHDESGFFRSNFVKAMLLGVGYAASIGGMATLVGTPTNAIYAAFVQQKMQVHVSFVDWLWVGFPFAAMLLIVCWWILVRVFPQEKYTDGQVQNNAIDAELHLLGPLSKAEWRVLWVFGGVVFCWVSGSLFWYRFVPNCSDTVVAVVGAIVLFLLPSGQKKDETLMDWPTAVQIPWGIIVFFGGGLALAKGFDQSGLASWLGNQMHALGHWPPIVIACASFILVILLSEIASNIATATMMMPVLTGLAMAMGIEPNLLLLTATLAASAGFGLPIANAANSVVYATGFIDTKDMARVGFTLDIVAVLLLTVLYGLFSIA